MKRATPPSRGKANDLKLFPFLDALQVYVYDLPPEYHKDLKKDQPRCITDQYGTEIWIHETLMHSKYHTRNPEVG